MLKHADLSGKRVLVVEDEYYIAAEIALELEDCGAMVLGPVGRIADALRLIKQQAPDAVILDIKLHGEAAYPVADELRRRAIPFIFATAYAQRDIPAAYRDVRCCEKPWEAIRLARALVGATW